MVENEPYRVTLALNGYIPLSTEVPGAQATVSVRPCHPGVADLVIWCSAGGQIPWSVTFKKQTDME